MKCIYSFLISLPFDYGQFNVENAAATNNYRVFFIILTM